MTVLTAFCTNQEIVFAADRAMVGQDNTVTGFRNKLLVLDFPTIKGVVCCAGISGFADAFGESVVGAYKDFDGIIDNMEVLARPAYERCSRPWIEYYGDTCPPPRGTLLIGGWSPRNRRCEMYKIHSAPKDVVVDGDAGSMVSAPPWTSIPIGEFYCSGSPCEESLRLAGLRDDTHTFTPVEWVIRHACAMRQDCMSKELPEGPFAVGGQIDVLLYRQDRLAMWVAHSWPDEIGKPTNPAVGDLVPKSFDIPSECLVVGGFDDPENFWTNQAVDIPAP